MSIENHRNKEFETKKYISTFSMAKSKKDGKKKGGKAKTVHVSANPVLVLQILR